MPRELDYGLLLSTIEARSTLEAGIIIDSLLASLLRNNRPPTVLIVGETGTGKSTLAKFLHKKAQASNVRNDTYVAINMATIPADLAESELFGYKKGAFTNALKDKPGLVEAAIGGTLLIDEIHRARPEVQAKLNMAIEEREYRPVGSVRSRSAEDIWFIGATTSPQEINDDLYFRLTCQVIRLRPLRENAELIKRYANWISKKVALELGRPGSINLVSEDAMDLLSSLPLGGNIRELENILTRALRLVKSSVGITAEDILSSLELSRDDLAKVKPTKSNANPKESTLFDNRPVRSTAKKSELLESIRQIIVNSGLDPAKLAHDTELQGAIARAYKEVFGNSLAPAARQLGIDVRTFSKRLKGYCDGNQR